MADGPPGTLEARQVRAMFDRIAGVYDAMNTVMTAGLHHQWRERAVALAGVGPGSQVIDVATGTGDLALEMCIRDSLQGVRVGGPPPRPLDRFFTRLHDGLVQVGPRYSVNSELRAFSPRDPGEPLDGIGQYLYPSRPSVRI